MELLDLTRHEAEEYEGKSIIWRECEYVVGSYLGSGAERITHKLVNRASELCLHVLKIWRRPDIGYVPSKVRAALAAGRTQDADFAKIIPISIEIELPGGRAEMQIYAAGSKDTMTPADALTQKGDEFLDNQKFQEAIQMYEQCLAKKPKHTRALVNLAAAHAQMKDLAAAYQAAAEARSIEPNYPLYHRACIEYLASQGLGRVALGDFRLAQKYFPNVFDFNDIGAELLLASGYPELALACAEDCLLDSADKQNLIKKIHAAVEARSNARALVDEASSLVKDAEPHRLLPLLEHAREINKNDPLLAINLALTLARAGRSGEAVPLLMYAAYYGPREWVKICFANAAFCAMDQGQLQRAMLLLDLTMSEFDFELRGRELENPATDLPGRGIWIDQQKILEERIDSAAQLVIRSVKKYQDGSTMSPGASRLAKLYAKSISRV